MDLVGIAKDTPATILMDGLWDSPMGRRLRERGRRRAGEAADAGRTRAKQAAASGREKVAQAGASASAGAARTAESAARPIADAMGPASRNVRNAAVIGGGLYATGKLIGSAGSRASSRGAKRQTHRVLIGRATDERGARRMAEKNRRRARAQQRKLAQIRAKRPPRWYDDKRKVAAASGGAALTGYVVGKD